MKVGGDGVATTAVGKDGRADFDFFVWEGPGEPLRALGVIAHRKAEEANS